MNQQKCSECKYLKASISPYRNSRSNWWCQIVRTECEPYRRIAQAKGDKLPIKTSPRWCPKKGIMNSNDAMYNPEDDATIGSVNERENKK